MIKILIDTCVWLDLAKDHKQQAIVSVLDELIENKKIELILPQIIIDEFARNKGRILEDSKRSLVGVISRVKDMVNNFSNEIDKEIVLTTLSDIQHKSPLLNEYVAKGSINWIDTLLNEGKAIQTSDSIKLRAAQRAIDKIAPFHRAKNNMTDAIIIETYISAIQEDQNARNKFIFITHNKDDFSRPLGNQKLPHPDFSKYFSTPRSRYFISLSEALNSIMPRTIPKMLAEQELFDHNPRTLTEILSAEDEIVTKVWYNRHQIRKEKIEEGSITIIEDRDFKSETAHVTITKSIWKGAQKNAEKVEKKFKNETLIWDDFEWGMLNGKLSALRWVLGKEWDELYT